jgi:hypothetical protein
MKIPREFGNLNLSGEPPVVTYGMRTVIRFSTITRAGIRKTSTTIYYLHSRFHFPATHGRKVCVFQHHNIYRFHFPTHGGRNVFTPNHIRAEGRALLIILLCPLVGPNAMYVLYVCTGRSSQAGTYRYE